MFAAFELSIHAWEVTLNVLHAKLYTSTQGGDQIRRRWFADLCQRIGNGTCSSTVLNVVSLTSDWRACAACKLSARQWPTLWWTDRAAMPVRRQMQMWFRRITACASNNHFYTFFFLKATESRVWDWNSLSHSRRRNRSQAQNISLPSLPSWKLFSHNLIVGDASFAQITAYCPTRQTKLWKPTPNQMYKPKNTWKAFGQEMQQCAMQS